MAITFGGLFSGIDTNSIIDQLVAAEKAPQTQLRSQQTEMRSRTNLISALVARLQGLSTSASSVDSSAELKSVKATSSDSTRVEIQASNAALVGAHQLSVTQLASAQVARSRTFASDTAGVAGDGVLSLKVGTDAPIDVAYTSADSLTDLAAKINSASRAVSASVLYDGTDYRLVIAGVEPGTKRAVTFADGGGGAGLAMSDVVPAKDAMFVLDGMTITRSSNTVSDVLGGITMTLKSETPSGQPPSTITVANDGDGVRAKVQGLVDSFNAVASFVQQQLTYSGVKKGNDTLFGDPGVQALQRKLAALAGSSFSDGTASSTLKDLGVSIDRNGQLSLDSSKLSAALAKDPKILERVLLGTGSNGVASAVSSLVKSQTNATDGVLTHQSKSLASRIKAYDDKIAKIDDSASNLETRLRLQFANLEKLVSGFQSQQNYLAGLSTGSG